MQIIASRKYISLFLNRFQTICAVHAEWCIGFESNMEIEDKERPIQVISLKKSGKFYGAVNRTDGVTATEQRMVCSMPKGAIFL